MGHASLTRPRAAHGFSLIELLLGLAIFTTAFLMILGVFPTSVRSIHQGRGIMLGTHLAQKHLEATLSQSFSTMGNSSQTESIISVVNGNMQVLTFNCQVLVTDVTADLKNVRCQVSWIDGAIPRTVNLETLVTEL
jgi:prepilin-type N-terminal cleavage/methylation domain-containing protein